MSDEKNLISVVIPAFKAEHSIARLCKEILKVFANHNLELVVVNDCSPDKTHEECFEKRQNLPTNFHLHLSNIHIVIFEHKFAIL